MKLIFVTSLLVILGVNTNAQDLGLKGLTIEATTLLYIESGEPKSVNTDQIFALSFPDKILMHLVCSDGSIKESQIYQIENDTSFMNEGTTIYKFEALSGISGKRYYYEFKIDNDGRLLSFKQTQPDGIDFTIYKGGITELKTYKK